MKYVSNNQDLQMCAQIKQIFSTSNFQPLEAAGHGSGTQFQVAENLNKSTQQDTG